MVARGVLLDRSEISGNVLLAFYHHRFAISLGLRTDRLATASNRLMVAFRAVVRHLSKDPNKGSFTPRAAHRAVSDLP